MTSAHTLCAILIAGSPTDDTERTPLAQEIPLHLTPLLGKTPLVFAVQALVEAGITHITCLGWDEPEQCQAQLQSGLQWGCHITWHSLSGPRQAFARLVDLAPAEGPFLLATTCSLMRVSSTNTAQPGTLLEPPATDTSDCSPLWNWAWLDRQLCQEMSAAHRWHEWPQALAATCHSRVPAQALSLMDGNDLLNAIPRMINRSFPVVLDATEVEPGIFLSRNVIIHPTAEIIAPFYAGPDVEIEKNCRIGPAVALSGRTHIGHSSRLSETQIGPDSWIGDALDLHECVVFRGVIWSRRHQARMTIFDALILAHGSTPLKWHSLVNAFTERTLALMLLFLLAPMLLLAVTASAVAQAGPKIIQLVRPDISHMAIPTVAFISWLGAHPCTLGWKHMVGFVLPNLPGVLMGKCHLSGARPRRLDQWAQLPLAHQRWLAQKACGLLQEEWVVGIQENDPLQSMVLERYQETRLHEWTYKWGLIWRYLHKILVNSNPVKLQAIKT
jgi:lipopolysaccharide/colanic/teichoic acid biosynthesis glycosyltransferase